MHTSTVQFIATCSLWAWSTDDIKVLAFAVLSWMPLYYDELNQHWIAMAWSAFIASYVIQAAFPLTQSIAHNFLSRRLSHRPASSTCLRDPLTTVVTDRVTNIRNITDARNRFWRSFSTLLLQHKSAQHLTGDRGRHWRCFQLIWLRLTKTLHSYVTDNAVSASCNIAS